VSSFLSVLFVEYVTLILVLENFGDGSCFFAYVSEFGPPSFPCVRPMFLVAECYFSYGGDVSVVMLNLLY
jgi:hypothetical protein